MSKSRETFHFGDFALDVSEYELRSQGRQVRLEKGPMDVLVLLVECRGQLVARSDIVERLWGKDVFVDAETGINTVIWKIRGALHDSPDAPMFVETVPGRGYRFIAPVEVDGGGYDARPFPPHEDPVAESRASDTGQGLSESSSRQARAKSFNQISTVIGIPPAGADAHPADDNLPRVAASVAAGSDPAVSYRRGSPNRVRLMVGFLLVAVIAGLVIWRSPEWGSPESPIKVAVLPFANLSGDPDREYLADGLAEETIASLGQVDPDRLSVVARTSTLAYKRTTKSAAEIGRELGADYLLESSIRAEGGRLRITSKLIRVRDQVQVWSESYNREPTSMLGLQVELSSAIAGQIRLRLSRDRLDTIARRQPRNADAYDLYLRGWNFSNQRTPATTRRAIDYFDRATALDPDYALAWAGLALTLAGSTMNGDAPPREVRPRARAAAAQAVRADPGLAEVQFALGYVETSLEWDRSAGEAGFRRAVALDPRYAKAHLFLGHALSIMGRHDEALRSTRRARDLDPLDPMIHALSSQVAYQARDYSAALEHARQAVVLDPEFWIGHMMLGQAHLQLGETDVALQALTIAARFSDHNSKVMSLRGYALARAGRTQEARELLGTLEAVSHMKYVPPYAMALLNAGLGQSEAAFAWLERAYEARDVHLAFLTVDPKWDPFRGDPRFEALLVRCGFRRTATTAPPTQ